MIHHLYVGEQFDPHVISTINDVFKPAETVYSCYSPAEAESVTAQLACLPNYNGISSVFATDARTMAKVKELGRAAYLVKYTFS